MGDDLSTLSQKAFLKSVNQRVVLSIVRYVVQIEETRRAAESRLTDYSELAATIIVFLNIPISCR